MGVAGVKGGMAHAQHVSRLAFERRAPQTDGTLHVPNGDPWDVQVRTGDPLFPDAPAFDAASGVPTLCAAETRTRWTCSKKAGRSWWWSTAHP